MTPTCVALRTALDVLLPDALALRVVQVRPCGFGVVIVSPEGAIAPKGGALAECHD